MRGRPLRPSARVRSDDGSWTASELWRRGVATLDAQELTVICTLCTGRQYRYTGPAAHARELIAAHRARRHPGLVVRVRKVHTKRVAA